MAGIWKRSSGACTTQPCAPPRPPGFAWPSATFRNQGGGCSPCGKESSGLDWTDDGTAHEVRHLKARAKKDSRPVPIPPHFVHMLREHVAAHGTAPDGRLFRTNRNGLLQETGYGEVWASARKGVPSEAKTASLLARRPYDLRHAGVSFWLSSGVDAMECARSAGHSIAVLHTVYAKVLDQTRERANSRIDAALREWNEPE